MCNLPVCWDPVFHHSIIEELAHPVIVALVILPDDHLVPGHDDGAELLLGGAVNIARTTALCLVNMRFGLASVRLHCLVNTRIQEFVICIASLFSQYWNKEVSCLSFVISWEWKGTNCKDRVRGVQ